MERGRGTLQWSYEECEPHARISYEANLVDPNAAWVRLTYTVNGHPVDYRIRLVTTRPSLMVAFDGGLSAPSAARGWWTTAARGSTRQRHMLRLDDGCTGRPKIGKSWMALDMAISVAAMSACLGDRMPDGGDVLYCALEDNERRLKNRLTKLLGDAETNWPDDRRYRQNGSVSTKEASRI